MKKRRKNRVFRYRVVLADSPPRNVCGLMFRYFLSTSSAGEKLLKIVRWRNSELVTESPFTISRPDLIAVDFLVILVGTLNTWALPNAKTSVNYVMRKKIGEGFLSISERFYCKN